MIFLQAFCISYTVCSLTTIFFIASKRQKVQPEFCSTTDLNKNLRLMGQVGRGEITVDDARATIYDQDANDDD